MDFFAFVSFTQWSLAWDVDERRFARAMHSINDSTVDLSFGGSDTISIFHTWFTQAEVHSTVVHTCTIQPAGHVCVSKLKSLVLVFDVIRRPSSVVK